MVMTHSHAKIRVDGQLIQKIGMKQTNRQTDTTDNITLPLKRSAITFGYELAVVLCCLTQGCSPKKRSGGRLKQDKTYSYIEY